MDTALAIAGGLGVLGLTFAVIILVRALLSGLKSERASFAAEILAGKAQIAAERAQWLAEKQMDQADQQRDDALAAQAKAEAERDAANAQLELTQRALNKAREEDAHEHVEAIRNAPTSADALAALDRLLEATARGDAVPAAGGGGAAGGDDHRAP